MIAVSIIFVLLAPATHASAHAFVQRYDLPVPLWYYLAGAGAVVALTFAMLAGMRTDAWSRPPRGVDLSTTWAGRMARNRALLKALAFLSAAGFALILAAGLVGNQEDPLANILPAFVWVGWWVGFAFFCALVGNIWPAVNPWTAVWRLFVRPGAPPVRRPIPFWLGVWPAVAFYLCFAWAELAWTDNAVPAKLAAMILIYSGITWAGMARYGVERWLACGETFSVLFDLFGRFAPIARESDGRIVLRPYGVGLVCHGGVSGSMVVFVVVVLASVSFDGFLHTPAWGYLYAAGAHALYDLGVTRLLGNTGVRTLIVTAGLFGASLCFIGVFLGICKLTVLPRSRELAGRPSAVAVARLSCLTLVPIAIAYHLTHYLVLLLVEGQRLYGHLSDPLGLGWDLFGTAGNVPDSSVVDARFVWLFSLVVIVVGHVIAVWLSHIAACQGSENRREALLPQIPMLVLMIGYTVLSLWIIGQPIVEV